jgi:hypothetical protein
MARGLHATLYSKQMGAGEVLESGYIDNKWEPVVPESVGATKLKYACKVL